jgi:hypothetical protein
MCSGCEREHLEIDARPTGGLPEVEQLLAHDLRTADQAAERAFVDDRV